MRNLGIPWILCGLKRFLYSGTLTVMGCALLTRVPNPFTLTDLFHSA
jgi:hypothetical protein